jgi:hypothetical protein
MIMALCLTALCMHVLQSVSNPQFCPVSTIRRAKLRIGSRLQHMHAQWHAVTSSQSLTGVPSVSTFQLFGSRLGYSTYARNPFPGDVSSRGLTSGPPNMRSESPQQQNGSPRK